MIDGAEEQETPLTEPVTCSCLFITGGAFEVSDGSIRLVAWVEMPSLNGQKRERRIVARLAMSDITGGDLNASLSEILARRRPN
jgi:hypothetical protein